MSVDGLFAAQVNCRLRFEEIKCAEVETTKRKTFHRLFQRWWTSSLMRRCHHAIGMRWNVMKQSEHTRYRKHLQLYVLLTQTFVSAFKGPQRHNKSICTSIAFQEILHTDDDVIHYRLRNQLSITSPLTSGQCTVVLNMLETVSPRHQTNDNSCRP